MVLPDRDEKGQFKKGHKNVSPGRPPRATETEYREAFYEVIPLDRFMRMVEAQARRAERGDIQAFNAIANRILPLLEKREHTGADGEPIRVVEIVRNVSDDPIHDGYE